MAQYSEVSLKAAVKSKGAAKIRSLNRHLKDRTCEHGTNKCTYCEMFAKDMGLLV